MYKKILILTFLILNTSISAMDLNETTVIIKEATEATQTLQNEFFLLVNEVLVPLPLKKEILELNNSTPPQAINPMSIEEVNTTFEINISLNNNNIPILKKEIFEINNSIEINSSISIKELNTSKKLSCQESNQSVMLNGLYINLDENNTISDNGCTDSNLGTSAEGLVIFKTRIKPYCEITGDKFAKQYMQEDWEDIYHDKEFKMEVIKACPKVEKRYKDKWTPHLYQFTVEYASDNDAIPEC